MLAACWYALTVTFFCEIAFDCYIFQIIFTSSVQRMCVVLVLLTCLCCLQAGDDTSSGNTSAGTSANDASADNTSADKAVTKRTGKVYDIEASSSVLGNRVASEKAADPKVNEFTALNLINC